LTNQKELINRRISGNPISYNGGKAKKEIVTKELIANADYNGLGTRIGFITNISSTLHSLLYRFPKNSDERIEIDKRLKICRMLQGVEIDGAKLGGVKKKVPPSWTKYSKELSNVEKNILADKRPLFMRHLYPQYDKKYKNYIYNYNNHCFSHWGMSFNSLELKEKKTKKQKKTIGNYYRYSDFIFTPSPMNVLSIHIENELDRIYDNTKKKKIDFDYKQLLSNFQYIPDEDKIVEMKKLVAKFLSAKKAWRRTINKSLKKDIYYILSQAKKDALQVTSDGEELGNLIVWLMKDSSRYDSFGWTVLGDFIVENLLLRHGRTVDILVKDFYGEEEFLFETYSNKKITL